MPLMKMVHEKDPKKDIWDKIKASGLNLDDITVFGNHVLVATYIRPGVTAGGIHLADTTRNEDFHQGKSGLVLKLGPSAFISDHNYDFKNQSVSVNDWVAIWVSDGRRIMLGSKDIQCRLCEDHHIRLKLPSPDCVF